MIPLPTLESWLEAARAHVRDLERRKRELQFDIVREPSALVVQHLRHLLNELEPRLRSARSTVSARRRDVERAEGRVG